MALYVALTTATVVGTRRLVSQAQHDLLMIAKMYLVSLIDMSLSLI